MVDNRREERDAAAAAMLRRFHGNTMRNMWQVKIHVWHFMQTIVHNLHRTPKLIAANAYKNELQSSLRPTPIKTKEKPEARG